MVNGYRLNHSKLYLSGIEIPGWSCYVGMKGGSKLYLSGIEIKDAKGVYLVNATLNCTLVELKFLIFSPFHEPPSSPNCILV